ncbi:MAG: hypothetical protein FJX76_06245 [Armatimonadetes bacterium]|nr:hypothetical protein [Armatimonadota bacterium]
MEVRLNLINPQVLTPRQRTVQAAAPLDVVSIGAASAPFGVHVPLFPLAGPAAAAIDLLPAVDRVVAGGVKLSRQKRFLCWDRQGWTDATPRKDADYVRGKFADAQPAWDMVSAPQASEPLRARADLLKSLQVTGQPAAVYRAVIESPLPLAEGAPLAVALASSLPPECSHDAAAIYRRLAVTSDCKAALKRVLEVTDAFRRMLEAAPLSSENRGRLLAGLVHTDSGARADVEKIITGCKPWEMDAPAWERKKGALIGGARRDNQAYGNATLASAITLPPGKCTLTADVSHEFSSFDRGFLTISSDGGETWSELKSFRDKKYSEHVEISLDAWAGKAVQIRSTISRMHEGGPYRVENLRLNGAPLDTVNADPLLDLLEDDRMTPAQRGAAVHAMAELAAQTSTADAMRLWSALRPADDAVASFPPADLDLRAQLLGALARVGSVDSALSAYPIYVSLEDSRRQQAVEHAKSLNARLAVPGLGLRLLPCLFNHLGDKDAENALAALCKTLGAERAEQAWKALESLPVGWAQRQKQFEAAWQLSGHDFNAALTDATTWTLTPAAATSLAAFAEKVKGWHTRGKWEKVTDGWRGGASSLQQEHEPLVSNSFAVPPNARLTFNEEHQLYSGDSAGLEISLDGGEFHEVLKFRNKGEVRRHDISLAEYSGRQARLRFTMNKTYDLTRGLTLREVNVGDRRLENIVCEAARAPISAMLAAGDRVEERLALLGALAEKAGDVTQGIRLYEALASRTGAPDWRDRMLSLVDVGGVEGALRAWKFLNTLAPQEADAALAALNRAKEFVKKDTRAWTMLESHLADADFPYAVVGAERLAGMLGAGPAAAAWRELEAMPGNMSDKAGVFTFCYRSGSGQIREALTEMASLQIPEGAGRGLSGMLDKVRPFDLQGLWGEECDSTGRQVFNCATNALRQEHTSLTSHVLEVKGIENPVLRFDARCDLYDRVDNCKVEVSSDMTNWRTLHTFTGQVDWASQEIPLEPAERLQIRFRIDKSYDRGNGFSARAITIGGKPLPGLASPTLIGGLRQIAADGDTQERTLALSFLTGLGAPAVERVLAFAEANKAADVFEHHTTSEVVARLASTAVLSGNEDDLERQLQKMLIPDSELGGVAVTDDEVIVNGVRVRRRVHK